MLKESIYLTFYLSKPLLLVIFLNQREYIFEFSKRLTFDLTYKIDK